jgi:hypothetical protein
MNGREGRPRGWEWAGRVGLWALAGGAAGVVGAAAGWVVGSRLLSLAPPCLFHRLTGLYCPGCGSTRAFYHLACGEPLAAIGSNPLLVVALPLLILAALEPRPAGSGRAGLRGIVYSPAIGWGFAAVTILFAVLRNLPFGAFRWLAP